MKQLLNYINEALIKKDTKINIISNFLIFAPWNDDFAKFRKSEYEDEFPHIRIIHFNDYNTDYIWIIKINEIEKIKPFITNSMTKLYYIPVEYSKDKFIKDCKDNKIGMEDIRKYEEYKITK